MKWVPLICRVQPYRSRNISCYRHSEHLQAQSIGRIYMSSKNVWLKFEAHFRVPWNFKIKNWYEFLRMTTVLYHTVPYCTVLYSTILYCTVQYRNVLHYTVTSLADTHLLIKLFMLGHLDKSLVVGGIAILASSSRGPGET